MLDVIDSLARAELRARNGQIELLLCEAPTRRGRGPILQIQWRTKDHRGRHNALSVFAVTGR